MDITQRLSQELSVKLNQVANTIELLDEGATVPFIARYRKEVTGGLDDTQLRLLAERLVYLRELEDRRKVIVNSITEQGKMTDDLLQKINEADNKTYLEDLYLPFKPKRRTKAQMAKEAGLEPLALLLWQNPQNAPEEIAEQYLNPEHNINEIKVALDGARAILMEIFSEDAALIGQLRDKLWKVGQITSKVISGQEEAGAKFADYFQHQESIASIPSHRALALLRARNEGIIHLNLQYQPEETAVTQASEFEQLIAQHFSIEQKGRAADKWLQDTVRLCWRAKVFLSLELDSLNRMREAAEEEAIRVFARNLRDLLLAAPAGSHTTIGLDPGLRTGVKVAVVDSTGKLLATDTIYPHAPRNNWQESLSTLSSLIKKHNVTLIAIGNGTASRETDKLAADLIKLLPQNNVHKIVVSEAGASVYSASELAAKEFPDLDVSLRGAVSIARRLQDPLAELVKIDPKAIGVGQYQHDVNQNQLVRSLDAVVEDCVNAVGVDVNTASTALLSHISGLNHTLAQNIVAYRDEHGVFKQRKQLLKVPRLGEKTFEQAAGFLRINDGNEPLDASGVHPEAYPVVEKMLKQLGQPIKQIMGNTEQIKLIQATQFTDERFGLPTILDILKELEKPGRDPRGEFKTATFADNVADIKDLEVGMILEGVITNVANFGAFVDVGVHQDGLVHISALADKYVSDPHTVVKAGDVVKVKVMDVDVARKRIGLSMRLGNDTAKSKEKDIKQNRKDEHPQIFDGHVSTVMADAFAKIKNNL
ncbi:Tex family protein [Neisseria sp. Ec49-e6-T10]|uniref:Tex family protein n=1 Tax=Neisseria sp. Ec49-e6-T10 TaxID=3140744 RepID=UPI003EBE9604